MAIRQFDFDKEKLVCDVHRTNKHVYKGCDLVDAHSVNDRLFNFWFENELYSVPIDQIFKIVFYEKEEEKVE